MTKKPNFLFIITDQQRADHLGCYGNTILRTPHIDGLAARGCRFDRFHVASPICMPNRATLMTGRMPSAHRCRGNGVPLPLNTTTIADLLQAAGYRTALIGKCHLQNMMGEAALQRRPEPDPSRTAPPVHLAEAVKPDAGDGPYDQEWLTRWVGDPNHDLTLPYYGFEHVELCIKHGDEVHGHYGRWLEEKHPGSDALRGAANALPGSEKVIAPFAWRTRVPEELYPTTYVADRTIAYLEDHTARGEDKPFFLQCSFPDPHHPFTPPGRYWDMFDAADMPLPPSFKGNETPALPHLDFIRAERDNGTRNVDQGFAIAVNEREAREATALTYGMNAMIDDAVGRIMGRIEALGLADDTVVVFTSDHGEYMGDHQLLTKGPLHYRGLIRVPFIWVDPGTGDPGRVCDDLAGSIDFAPTILDRAGLQPFYGMQGRSLSGLLAGNVGAIREALLIEEENQRVLLGFDAHPRARTVITSRRRLTVYDRVHWGELYDLEEDPHEMCNLWDDPDSLGEKCEMLDRMAHEMIELADRSPFPIGRS